MTTKAVRVHSYTLHDNEIRVNENKEERREGNEIRIGPLPLRNEQSVTGKGFNVNGHDSIRLTREP